MLVLRVTLLGRGAILPHRRGSSHFPFTGRTGRGHGSDVPVRAVADDVALEERYERFRSAV